VLTESTEFGDFSYFMGISVFLITMTDIVCWELIFVIFDSSTGKLKINETKHNLVNFLTACWVVLMLK